MSLPKPNLKPVFFIRCHFRDNGEIKKVLTFARLVIPSSSFGELQSQGAIFPAALTGKRQLLLQDDSDFPDEWLEDYLFRFVSAPVDQREPDDRALAPLHPLLGVTEIRPRGNLAKDFVSEMERIVASDIDFSPGGDFLGPSRHPLSHFSAAAIPGKPM